MEIVSARGLSCSYGQRAVLDSLRFGVRAGEKVGLLGPNGAGKSTLLYALAGLVKFAGEVAVFSTDMAAAPREARGRIGFVFENPDDQLFSLTVAEDVGFFGRQSGWPEERIAAAVSSALARTGLSGYEERHPFQLSFGEKRRAALATVLSYAPELLLLDEPTNNLDPASRRELAELIRRESATVICASHDIEFLRAVAGRAVILSGGRIAADGPADEILADKALLLRHRLA